MDEVISRGKWRGKTQVGGHARQVGGRCGYREAERGGGKEGVRARGHGVDGIRRGDSSGQMERMEMDP